jgi:Tol biopolymer transport system component
MGPVWSSDGLRIAYLGPVPDVLARPPVPGFTHVLVVNADGSGVPKLVATAPRGQNLAEVRWAAGGRFVYEDSNYTLWSTAGHGARRLGVLGVTGIVGESFSLSRDGREVAFTAPCGCKVAQGNEVQFVAASGGADRVLPHPKNALDSDPNFSPNGHEVAFTRVLTDRSARTPFGNEDIEIAGVQGGSARWLGVHGATPVFSPDGRWIAFVGRAGIQVVAAAGGHARTLLPLRCCSIRAAYSWSPDSTTLAYVSDTGAGTVGLTGARTRFSLPGLHPDLHTPQWSPDGKTVAFGAIRNGDDLGYRVYLIGGDGAGLRRIA